MHSFRPGGRLIACVVLALGLLICPRALGLPGGGADHDLFYRVLMDGSPAGWMHSVQKTEGDRIRNSQEMRFKIRRGEATTSARMTTEFVETKDGKPISMRSSQQIGAQPVVVEYTFGEQGIQVVSDPAGTRTVSTRPLPKETWLTPAAAANFVLARLKASAKEISYRTIDPLSGTEPVAITHTQISRASQQIGDRTIEGYSMRSSASNSPGVVGEDFLDLGGTLAKQTTSLGGLSVVMIAAGPEVTEDKGRAPEVMVSSFIKPDRVIHDPYRTTRALYTLDYVSGEVPAVPQTGTQTVTAQNGTSVTISVNALSPRPAPAADIQNDAFTRASGTISSDDALVRELASTAVKAMPREDTLGRAQALRRAVYNHITEKNLDVGFAAASEIVRTRRGDCTEHAVLLAAALRADGIPSRVAGGLIYADRFAGQSDIFGYHMWVEALIDVDGSPRWVDLDATLSENPGFDATHIALFVSALADADGSADMLGVASAMGRLKISVGDLEYRR